ncbi:hypothetical protein BDP55DRAFT_253281 [Colletotrichum godetiae]|uniref:Uncharacterized protein n=1 Tax=Colletotrichum godetiae TaxID=1209918 RepID=A0AAJ0AEA2_9PEZI|nr:uncharacterized protein BDP55DRAFT_253281 [Colletotrichum godetiae]KAK1672289.1 hypothetical protein BDP55DRAFT_253281 [Colletotrichum godetiae]
MMHGIFLSGVCVLCVYGVWFNPILGKPVLQAVASLSHSSITHSRHVRPAYYAPPRNLILPAFAGTDAKGGGGGRGRVAETFARGPFFPKLPSCFSCFMSKNWKLQRN